MEEALTVATGPEARTAVLGELAALPEAECRDEETGEPVAWPPRGEYLADGAERARKAEIAVEPLLEQAAAEWGALTLRPMTARATTYPVVLKPMRWWAGC